MGKVGQIRQEKVEDLVPYAKNARVHDDEQVELIAKSIEEFGFLNPILVDKDKNVIAGHGRILAAKNQEGQIRCGDNGIFKGVPVTVEQTALSATARAIYKEYPTDGKYIYDKRKGRLIICQSHAKTEEIEEKYRGAEVNPLGDWTGGMDVDTGATNRKLGSDMGDSVTGGGLHGKDLSKADVSVNIYAWLKAQNTGKTVEVCCAIGDTEVGGIPYEEIVEVARRYIRRMGGFERFAEWGLI